jgi:hypothetical protein
LHGLLGLSHYFIFKSVFGMVLFSRVRFTDSYVRFEIE